MKKAVSVFLCIILSVSIVFGFTPSIYAEQSQVEKIVAFAKSKIGSTEYVGLCQAFVYQCYKAAGIDNGSASSAIAAWNKWGVSTSKTNIPIGACVYFDEKVGSAYGHVGIYIGDNKMIHSRQSVGKVVESSMTWYLDNCYLGWGWQGGVEPSSNPPQDSSSDRVSDYFLLTSPDGYQTMRSSYSTSSNKILDITIPAIVCVTKYSPDDKWGYITYNGKSGWIRLYYVEKHSHSYGAWQTTKAATCTTTGTKKQTCECGLYKTSKIDALGHKFSAWKTTKNATCTVNGEKKRTCSVCSFSEKGTVSATGHNYSGEWTIDKAASCVNNGQKSHHCLNCDSKIDITNISPVGHNFGEWKTIKEATTKASGKTQRNCKNSGCSEVETKTIAKLAEDGHSHKFGNWEIKKDATCVKEGSKERKCEICSESESMSIAGKGHTFGESIVTKEATETEKGIKTKTCTVCNVTEEEEIPYLTAEPENDEKTDAVVDIDKAVVDIDKKEGSNNIFWIIIAIAAVVLIGGGVTAVILIKKKK